MISLFAGEEVPRKMALMATRGQNKVVQELAMKLADGSTMLADCARKPIYDGILNSFTSLAGNLTVENATRYQRDLDLYNAKQAAYNEYLASASAYRTAESDETAATEASKFAEGKLNEYSAAVKIAQKVQAEEIAPTAEERAGLVEQASMIDTISALISKMNEGGAGAKADPVQLKAAEEKLNTIAVQNPKLSKLAKEVGAILTKMAQVPAKKAARRLMGDFSETVKQALQILDEMKADITARISQIDAAKLKNDKELADNQAQVRVWEVKVVELGDAKDEAMAKKNAANLERERLSGINAAKTAAYEDQHAGVASDMASYARQINALNLVIGSVQKLLAQC